jgi:hypothetical protein
MVVQGDKQMVRNAKQPKTNATPGFAIKLEKTTDLGIGMLIAEFSPRNASETFRYEPIGPVATIGEAYEIAECNLKHRPHATYPDRYIVWAAGLDGDYRVAHTIVF